MSPTPTPPEAPSAQDVSQVIRRIQHALLDGHVVTLNDELGRLVLAKSGQELPPSPNTKEIYGARESGVFREVESIRGPEKSKRWVRWSALEDLEDFMSPQFKHLNKPELDAIAVGLTFQVAMTKTVPERPVHRRPRP